MTSCNRFKLDRNCKSAEEDLLVFEIIGEDELSSAQLILSLFALQYLPSQSVAFGQVAL